MGKERVYTDLYTVKETELRVKSKIVKFIVKNLCNVTKKEDFDGVLKKVKKVSRIRIKKSKQIQVVSVPKSIVEKWLDSVKLAPPAGMRSDHDLTVGKYEGGFKVWESSVDLVEFVSTNNDIMQDILNNKSDLQVLELGAGASLPSLALMRRLDTIEPLESSYRLHVQDYNWQVLASLTLLNYVVNSSPDKLKALIKEKRLRFYHGDWAEFDCGASNEYDLIIMSEVLYNVDTYDALHDLLDKNLKRDGHVLIATKCTYFGLTGGSLQWQEHLERHGKFSIVYTKQDNERNIPRSILVMRRTNFSKSTP